MEPEADVYDELTQSADEAFQMLDELERQDAEATLCFASLQLSLGA